jgi:predicted DNA-binding ribbon-helix-helix protein
VKSLVLKRSVVIAGRKTSVCVEEEFWNSVKEIAGERNITVMQLVREIDANREHDNLSSAIRLFVIGVYRDRIDFAKAGTADSRLFSRMPPRMTPRARAAASASFVRRLIICRSFSASAA